jgi:hypothetical protein
MPNRSQELFLADHAVTVPDEMNEQIENLGLDGDQPGSAAQLASVCVEHTILE